MLAKTNSRCEISGEGGTLAGQNSRCEISGEGRTLAGQNSRYEISGEGGTLADRIPDVRYPEKERVEDVESININNPTSSINPWVKSGGNYAE